MKRRALVFVVGLVAASALIVILQWHATRAQRRAILALAPAERVALLGRTRRNLDALCGAPVLASECTAEARLLLLLPECTADCREEAVRRLPHATR